MYKMGMEHTQSQTIAELCQDKGVPIDTVRRAWSRKVRKPFSKMLVPSEEEVAIIFTDNRKTAPYLRALSASSPQNDQAKIIPEPDSSADIPPPGATPDTTTAPAADKTTGQQRTKQQDNGGGQRRTVWPLVFVMIFCVGTTIPNMYAVTLAVKNDPILAAFFTACFTLSPFFLMFAGVRGLVGTVAILFIIMIEIFCNTAGIYGGLTGLNHANFIEPTTFLHMATGFAFDSAYEPTARAIAVFMASGVAILMAVSVYEIRKRTAQ